MIRYCPDGFQLHPTVPDYCVAECPKEKGYVLRMRGEEPACMNFLDPGIFVILKNVGALSKTSDTANEMTLNALQGDPRLKRLADAYVEAKTDLDENLAIQDAKIDKAKKLQGAFKELQDAENARDQAPQAYQNARVKYYTMLSGDQWLETEKDRLARTEINPTLDKITNTYNDLVNRIRQQSNTIQIVDGVKDKLGSLRDEFQFSVGTFGKQVQELKNQIQIERKKKEEEKVISTPWFDILLNVLIVGVLIYAIFVIFKRVVRPKPITPNVYS